MATSAWILEKDQKLANGYIRRQYTNSHMPQGIILIIINFAWYLKDHFMINKQRSFAYDRDIHHKVFHIFGSLSCKRNDNKCHQWIIQTDGGFAGRIGVINDTKEYYLKVENGRTLRSTDNSNTIACGIGNGYWPGWVYGGLNEELRNFVAHGKLVIIDVDFKDNKTVFQSENGDKVVTIKLNEEWMALRLIIEIAGYRFNNTTLELI